MIDKISSKQSDLDGQLEVIDIDNSLNLAAALFRTNILEKDPQLILACNQLDDIFQVIGFARHNLIFSSGHMSREFTKKFMNTDDSDAIETISSFFLSSSILFYNSSFDYLWILLMLVLSSHQELINKFPEDKVEDIMKKYKLNEEEWHRALFEKITKLKWKNKKNWIENKLITDNEIKEKILDIMDKNETLRFEYQANNLKHGEFPYFRRSNLQNVIGAKLELSKKQFYLESGNQGISFGLPKRGLNIDDVQKFLIDYNNRTVEVINFIIEKMKKRKKRDG